MYEVWGWHGRLASRGTAGEGQHTESDALVVPTKGHAGTMSGGTLEGLTQRRTQQKGARDVPLG